MDGPVKSIDLQVPYLYHLAVCHVFLTVGIQGSQ